MTADLIIPPYLEATTGYSPADGSFSPLAQTAGQFLLQLWYYGENADTEKLQRVIDCLLKALSAERAFLLSQNYICERCGKPAEIAHHRTYLTAENLLDPAISLTPANLEALCKDCHNAEHFGQGGATAAGLAFDDNGDIVPTNTILKGR